VRFEGKVALITGGAVGFGRSFARGLAAEGAAIVIADIDLAGGDATVAELRAGGHRAIATRCDVADAQEVAAAVGAAVDAFGGIDILINNAGRHLLKYSQPFQTLTPEEIRGLFEVNVMGNIACTMAARPAMARRGGGVVVNIASISGHMGGSPYGVTKLAIRGLTMAFASELADDRIRVNAVSPGLTLTEAGAADFPDELVRDFAENKQLIHRPGTMEDVTKVVLFLCSDDAAFITGETVKVSGGFPLGI
jgi:NAD(P)-dependent dehydrogenase (short-subunit alcohol dehydrogenase family)